ncbi:MAG: HIT family protein [Parvibaculaceae bacterium]|nr:HIT family protein [Parvibaculaceae bacterium]
MANATQIKFGYPDTLIAETPFWSVQTRPAQPTLGALVLICKEPVTAFGEVSPEAFSDLRGVTAKIERRLKALTGYQRINYLMLMMVDLDVHFHVLPRYEGEKGLGDIIVPDRGWPGVPALGDAVTLTSAQLHTLTQTLRAGWDAGSH